MQTVLVIEGVAVLDTEDGGQAMIVSVSADGVAEWVKLHSWCEGGTEHPLLAPLAGKKLRVTVELVDGHHDSGMPCSTG